MLGSMRLEGTAEIQATLSDFKRTRFMVWNLVWNVWVDESTLDKERFIDSFVLPRSEWSWISDPDPHHPKGTHPKFEMWHGTLRFWQAIIWLEPRKHEQRYPRATISAILNLPENGIRTYGLCVSTRAHRSSYIHTLANKVHFFPFEETSYWSFHTDWISFSPLDVMHTTL